MTNIKNIKQKNLKEKIIKILHEHTRKIIIEGKNKPLLRRAIKNQTADQLLELFKQEKQKLIKEIEGIEITEYQGTKISAYLRNLKMK